MFDRVVALRLFLSVLYCTIAAATFALAWRKAEDDDDLQAQLWMFTREQVAIMLAVACFLWPALLAIVVVDAIREWRSRGRKKRKDDDAV